MRSFNLIISTFRFAEEDAEDESLDLLEDFGDGNAESEISEVSGLVLCSTTLDPFYVTEKMAEIIRTEPWRIRFILRAIPIEQIVETNADLISNNSYLLSQKKMTQTDTFRITIEKRHCHTLSSNEIITSVASRIPNKVKLIEPDWTVLIEIIGKRTGISVLKEVQIFSSMKEKRGR